MIHVFTKTNIGFSHVKDHKVCQDFTSSYQDPERSIISCCDGHGGDVYIRSQYGSHLACNAVITILSSLNHRMFNNYSINELEENIKLQIICEWNKNVERFLSDYPITKYQLKNLKEEDIDKLINNPVKAFGTTLTGAMIYDNKMIVVNIGDSECIAFKDGNIFKVFEDDDEPVANITYSMCQEDAKDYFRVKIIDLKQVDGIILCTDGFSTPYQSYDNFYQNLVKPLVYNVVKNNDYHYAENIVKGLADQYGTGDDVSLSFMIKDKIKLNLYQK